MRTLAAVTIAGLVALSVASSAGAAPTVDLLWTGTTGAGVTGSNSIDAATGDTLTLTINVVVAPADGGLTGMFLTPSWDGTQLTGQNAVECPSPPNIGPGTCGGFISGEFLTYSPLAAGVTIDNVAGTAYQFDAANIAGSGVNATANGFTITLGTIQYVVGASSGTHEIALLYTPGDEVITDNAFNSFFPNASAFVVVPEPATGGLLALGLGALAFVGRRRA